MNLLNNQEFARYMGAWSFCELLNENCEDLAKLKAQGLFDDYHIITSGLDKGAFNPIRLGGDKWVIIYGSDGTTSVPEWINNFKLSISNGMHEGWDTNGELLFHDMIDKMKGLGIDPEDVVSWVGRGHSRGGPLTLKMSEMIFDLTGIMPEVTTFGAPPCYTDEKIDELEEVHPYSHVAIVNEGDFVDNIRLPKLFKYLPILRHMYDKHQLYHFADYIVELPNARGEFDHTNYGKSIIASHELWKEKYVTKEDTRE